MPSFALHRAGHRLPPFMTLGIAPLLAALLPLLLPIARNLEYEYVTLASYLVLLLFPLLALTADVKLRYPRQQWIIAAFAASLISPLPAWIGLSSKLCLCAQDDFWVWWLIQFIPHFALGLAAFFFVLQKRQAGHSRRFCSIVLLSILVVLLLQLGWTLWTLPQKRITHLLAGFIHGAIYDNWIPLDTGILLARATHFLLALILLTHLLIKREPWRFWLLALLVSISLFTSLKAKTYPSQSQGLQALAELMPSKKTGERFTIHYREPTSEAQRLHLEELYAATIFHMKDLAAQLLVYDTHVHIFVYPSREDKKLWFGGDGTDITDVVTPSIHINLEAWPHPTLRHELVHALSSSFAFHGLGFHPNLAFTEGLAVALAPLEEDISLHAGAASLVSSGRLAQPTALFSPLFWSQSGRRAYTVAGSILKFLIDRYGIAKVKELYGGASWQEVFGAESGPILKDWEKFLRERYPAREETITAEALFRYPGILDDICPHSKALLAKSSGEPLTQWRQPSGWIPKHDYWPWRLKLSQDPDVRLSALQEEVNQLWESFTPAKAEKLFARLDQLILDPPRAIEDIETFILRIDLLVALKRYEEAAAEIKDYQKVLSSYQIGDGLVRQLWVRYLLLIEPDAETRPWLRFLAGIDASTPRWRQGQSRFVTRYLYLRNYNFGPRQQKFLEGLAQLELAEGLPDTFGVEWHRSLGVQWMRGGFYHRAAEAFAKASELAPEGKREALTLYVLEAKARDKEARSSQNEEKARAVGDSPN